MGKGDRDRARGGAEVTGYEREPVDVLFDLGLETDLRARFRMPVANHEEAEVEPLLKSPATVLGLSDAGAHASQLCDACLSTYLLRRWVREKEAIPLPEAIRMLCSRIAALQVSRVHHLDGDVLPGGHYELRQGDGLQPLAGEALDVVCMAGIGAATIVAMLEDGLSLLADAPRRLVLNPIGNVERVRVALPGLGYELRNERALTYRGLEYPILVVERATGT